VIPVVDRMLGLIIGRLPNVQIGFEPPDEDWFQKVTGQGASGGDIGPWVNVYLADVREREPLRSRDPIREVSQGVVTDRPAPSWVDCHYLITAWSSATPKDVRPAEEHIVLAEILRVLIQNQPLTPERLLTAADLTPLDPALARLDFPTSIAPQEGFKQVGEFWTSIGDHHRWKPSVHVVITCPIVPVMPSIDGIAETILIETGTWAGAARVIESPEEAVLIGGVVLDPMAGSPGAPRRVAGAHVALAAVDANGAESHLAETTTGDDGRFRFDRVPRGRYLLRWRSEGRQSGEKPVEVPSTADDDYVLTLA
jgi:Pvc16 N-terminal domain/Carboxypeptidase regulatory-like domain